MDVSSANAEDISAYDALDDETLAAWDPEGDLGRRVLLNPTIFRILGLLRGVRVLDAGCGQGYLSRLLADRGASVVGVEPASRLVGYARRMEERRHQGIEYFQRDLSRLGDVGGPFDAVVANMVLLDIADWEAAMSNCVTALRPGGRFVFSLLHPCWPPDAMSSWAAKGCVEVREYLQEYEIEAPLGTNFHRPLSAYINKAVDLGCAVIELAEPGSSMGEEMEILAHIPNYVVVSSIKTGSG